MKNGTTVPVPFVRAAQGARPKPSPRAHEDESDEEFVPRGRRKPNKSKARVYTFAVLGGLVLAGAAALGAKFLSDRPAPVVEPENTKKEFVTGEREELFNHRDVFGWQGQGWSKAEDGEGTSVLTGEGTVRRPFKPPANFRLVLGLDPYNATRAEVVVAVAADSPKRWSIRLDRAEGAAFGVREGEAGSFQPLGPTVPVPEKDEEKVQYGEVKYERAGGRIRAFYLGKLLGEIEDAGLAKATDARLTAEGGPVRIDTAAIETLVEKR